MIFSENLKALRCQHDIGQKWLAEKLNTTVKTVSHWETGYSEPSISQLIAIAKLFNVSIDELVGLESDEI